MKTRLGVALGTGLAGWLMLGSSAGCQVSVGEEVDGTGGKSSPNDNEPTGGRDDGFAGGSGAGGASEDPSVEDCDSDAPETNDTRETAWPLLDGATLCVRAGNEDWLFVGTPDDGKAHILEVTFDPEPGASVHYEIEVGSDGSSIGGNYSQNGADQTAWITLGPHVHALLRVVPFSAGGLVRVSARMESETDEYSPNQSADTAAEIPVNEEITAEFHQPYSDAANQPFWDWYSAELAEGPHTISFLDVVASQQVEVEVTNPRGERIASGYSRNGGALFDLDFEAELSGTYRFLVTDFMGGPGSLAVGNRPAALSDSYTFEIIE